MLVVVDEYTRECLALEVNWKIGSAGVLAVLSRLFAERGAPKYIRSDNGPEFIAKDVINWLQKRGAETLFVAPGSPWENGYVESFNGRLRDELLNREMLSGVREARVILAMHRRWYNEERIHSGIDYMTPQAYSEQCSLTALAS